MPDEKRLHLHHGPIDLIIEAWGPGKKAAYRRAEQRFETVLQDIVKELSELRMETICISYGSCALTKRMYATVSPFASDSFVTPMVAVAGAVADEICNVMACEEINKAYVNNGGDVALHLTPGQSFDAAMPNGVVSISAEDGIGGIATSGWGGRSHSLGIADSVTVLARTAAQADAAATLIANAVDLDHPKIRREPANTLSPDSDLGHRLVTRYVPPLTEAEKDTALLEGLRQAEAYQKRGLITGAALTLQGQLQTLTLNMKELVDA